MSRPLIATVLDEEEREEAFQMGAHLYLRSLRYRHLRDRIFKALDGGVASMKGLRFPNPYDGRILGTFGATIVRKDRRALAYLRRRKVEALTTNRDRFFELLGCLIAEDFLARHTKDIPREALLSPPAAIRQQARALIDEMERVGMELGQVPVGKDSSDLGVTFSEDDSMDLANAVVDEAVHRYEAMVPETDADNDVPDPVERRAISKAAFLQLTVNDLAEITGSELARDLGEAPTKAEMVQALTDRYGDDIDAVARLVIRQSEGDPGYGLVSRLVPLREPPDTVGAEATFAAFRGRYLEAKTAVFFLFGDVRRLSNGALRIAGRVRSFSVAPASVGDEVRMSPRSRTENVQITLRDGEPWAEVSARRVSDLAAVRNILRRTELVPASEVARPDRLTVAPFETWDTRTLWMLEFLRKDLQAPDLRLDDTLMANFVTPKEAPRLAEEDERRRPNVDAVRLLGRQLHEHPEASARIASGAHLRDIELRLRHVTDRERNFSKLVRFRLSWESDHLAVLSGADDSDNLDPDLHRQVVRLVRNAANRALDEERLLVVLRNIQRRSTEEVAEDESILGDGSEEHAA
jgi:hypothetical protein